ncbi:DUF5719 family protein [Agromyces aurantiacus]|uniref:DUF5719 family protein n=1 Tax=Agromyces aurantiacus TaxID=165814 RepID=A0ABV9R6B9_9MICO|nr:DUF5719 family protein [Agromyces aurantiacus]MBM7504189.1 hypothetical protein [Agromyces aurantiacus]
MRVKREVLVGIGRAAAVLVAAAAAAGLLAAAVVVPRPGAATEVPSTIVQPAESRQLRVCPGPLLELAEDAASATAATSFGPPTVAIAAEPADAVVEQAPVAAPDNSAADSDGGPVSIAAEPGAVDAGMLAGAQSQEADAASVRGLAVAACAEPAAESWLVAGATDVGRSGLVLLANPGSVPSTVDVRVIGESGPVDAPGGIGVVVPPGTQRAVSLAGLAPNVRSTVVHVTSTGSPIAAALQHSVVLGLEPAGVELSTPVAPPAVAQVIPGLVIADRRGIAPQEDHAEGDDHPAVRLLATESATPVAIELRDASGTIVSRIEAELEAGRAVDIPLGTLDPGAYTALVTADSPVVAAARATVLGEGDDPVVADLAWTAASAPLLDGAALAVPPGPQPVLHLANAGDVDAVATVAVDGDAREVAVPAGGAASLDLRSDARVVLTGVEGLYGSVSFSGDAELSSMPISPPGPLDAPVRVYPQ